MFYNYFDGDDDDDEVIDNYFFFFEKLIYVFLIIKLSDICDKLDVFFILNKCFWFRRKFEIRKEEGFCFIFYFGEL